MSNHHLLMFSWSPLGLFCVVTSSSHPCSKHSWWVTFASMKSVSHPIISCHSIPSIFAYRSSCFSHFGPHSYCPHPLRSWVSCCQVNHALYALTREVICLSLSPTFSIVLGVSPSFTLLFSFMPYLRILIASPIMVPILLTSTYLFQKNDLEDGVSWFQLPPLFDTSDQEKGLIIALWLGCFMFVFHTLDGPVMQQIVPVIPRCVWDVSDLMRGWPFK